MGLTMSDTIAALLAAAMALHLHKPRHRRREREAERLQRLNSWQHWPAPQSAVELEQQVADSREAREWARRNPELARELVALLAGHE